MDIDLLFSGDGQAGLISSENLVKKLAGVVIDMQTGILMLEYTDMDNEEMNIPVDQEFFATLDYCKQIHIGAIKDGHIAQAYQVPFMFQDNPYRLQELGTVEQHPKPLQAFEYFVKSAVRGQPVHRDDLDNDESLGCVLGDSVPSSLQFAPHLARRHQMEIAPKGPAPGNVPGLGLGSSGGGTVRRTSNTGQGGDKDGKKS
ncbi:hypothetical protein N9Z27_01060 [Alphaproteobacteria bacterium]|nr:hypothetical protein [Alphaproteobacteria bacterium]